MHASDLLRSVINKPQAISSSSHGNATLSTDLSSNASKAFGTSLQNSFASSLETMNPILPPGTQKQPTKPPVVLVCLCSPTNHAGSFRCRLHRASKERSHPKTPLQRTSPPPYEEQNSSARIQGHDKTMETRGVSLPACPAIAQERGRISLSRLSVCGKY
eukprot:c22822_g1_i1 orf=229-708(+)